MFKRLWLLARRLLLGDESLENSWLDEKETPAQSLRQQTPWSVASEINWPLLAYAGLVTLAPYFMWKHLRGAFKLGADCCSHMNLMYVAALGASPRRAARELCGRVAGRACSLLQP